MKILFISHSHENSGFSYSAHTFVKSLIAAGLDVVCRHIKLNQIQAKVPDFIEKCEKKNLDGCTHVIQYLLPHHMSYVEGLKNIGICMYDLDSLRYCGWDRCLNCMDEIWLPQPWSSFQHELTPPTRYIPICCDTSVYKKKYQKLDIKQICGTYVFYTIADLNIRKNIRDTALAFYNEFHTNEPVSLVIKSGASGMTPEASAKIIMDSFASIKNDTKLYPHILDYKTEIVITNHLSEDEINMLHITGDCFVNTSRSEAWSIPSFDAWSFGNRVIYYRSENTCYPFLNGSSYLYSVKCNITPSFGYNDTFPQLGSTRENWCDSNIPDLQKAMRNSYNDWKIKPKKIIHNNYEEYSYESVGKKILKALNE
jgi:hypothetical protein